jgi:hypothetical protein
VEAVMIVMAAALLILAIGYDVPDWAWLSV